MTETSAPVSVLNSTVRPFIVSFVRHGGSSPRWSVLPRKYFGDLGRFTGLAGRVSLISGTLLTFFEERHTRSKWLGFLQALHFFPLAGHVAPLL